MGVTQPRRFLEQLLQRGCSQQIWQISDATRTCLVLTVSGNSKEP